MRRSVLLVGAVACGVGVAMAFQPSMNNGWAMHDRDRPLPEKVKPAPMAEHDGTTAPSDAILLFDGSHLRSWEMGDGSDAAWHVREDGSFQVKPGTGIMRTKDSFGDVQLHIEWMCPADQGHRTDQDRGNSGVFFMGLYEVQVLSTHENRTYADGMAGSVYGQNPPMVNPIRPMGEWNAYDIIFRRPHFDDDGNVTKPATVTVFFNGVLVQDHFEMVGPASWMKQAPYKAHEDALPLVLQDHGEPVKFRNVWVRELE
jgi:hypothetical protein